MAIICFEKQRNTVSFEKQIMSEDKYPSLFLHQMEAIVLTILQIFFAIGAILKIGEYHVCAGRVTACSLERMAVTE